MTVIVALLALMAPIAMADSSGSSWGNLTAKGLSAYERGDLRDAIKYLRAASLLDAPSKKAKAEVLLDLGCSYAHLFQTKAALAALQKCIELAAGMGRKGTLLLLKSRHGYANAEMIGGQLAPALKRYRALCHAFMPKGVAYKDLGSPAFQRECLSLWSDAATCCCAYGCYGEGIRDYEAIKAFARKQESDSGRELLTTEDAAALAYGEGGAWYALARYDKARSLFKRGLALATECGDSGWITAVCCRMGLAAPALHTGHPEESEKTAAALLKLIREKAPPWLMARAFLLSASSSMHAGHLARAETVLEGMHDVLKGKRGVDWGQYWRLRAKVALAKEDYQGALKLGTKGEEWCKSAYPPKHPRTARMELLEAEALVGLKRYKEAFDVLNPAMKVLLQYFRVDHPLVRRAVKLLLKLAVATGRKEEAKRLRAAIKKYK